MEDLADDDAHGPRPWDRAWHDALYGTNGFYRRSAPAQHFATSVQGIPGGGAVLAAAVVELARRHGCRRIVDVGAGGGELLVHVQRAAPDLHLTGVDVADHRPGDVPVGDWMLAPGGTGLPEGLQDLTDTLVVAHEWLDVVPCPVVQRQGEGVWREVLVARDGTEALGRPLLQGRATAGTPDDAALRWLARWVPDHVVRAEMGLARDEAAVDLLARIRRGVLLVVDYGHDRAGRPPDGTLTGFRDGHQVAPVPDGTCDLTAHVAVDSLLDRLRLLHGTEQAHLTTQREALRDLLPRWDAPVPHDLARREPTSYLHALARRAALQALSAPGGLGDFSWLVAVRQ